MREFGASSNQTLPIASDKSGMSALFRNYAGGLVVFSAVFKEFAEGFGRGVVAVGPFKKTVVVAGEVVGKGDVFE